MKTILFPTKESWPLLCKRPLKDRSELEDTVRNILSAVKRGGNKALFELTEKLDGASTNKLRVSASELFNSSSLIPDNLKSALNIAKTNIEKFHSVQIQSENSVETSPGIKCWRKNIPLERVGLYIPGGTAPLFSTVLMLAIPAKIAGCKEIIICTPPDRRGDVNPLILYAALISGVTHVFRAGGAQAIAAMAFGTESIPGVDKIFGPGNQYVTKAKELVQLEGIPIDMPAGPSEVMVIADNTAEPVFIAADLLSQAEHGSDSHVVLVTDSDEIITAVHRETERQLGMLPRKKIASEALKESLLIQLSSLDECVSFCNLYAPEHLIISVADCYPVAEKVINAGSVFLGKYSCESAGDYATGTNHTLPTNGFAKNYSGVSTDSFLKKVSFQEVTEAGLKIIGPAVELLAEAEHLIGHKNAISVRLKSMKNV